MDGGEGEGPPQDCQNLSDIQNYLVTFNKEIERGDASQFQTVSLTPIPATPESTEVGSESASVQNVPYQTVYYDGQSLLPADPNDGENIESESISTIQSFVVQGGHGETTHIKTEPNISLQSSQVIKQEESVGNVSILDATDHDLSAVHAQIAELSGSGEAQIAELSGSGEVQIAELSNSEEVPVTSEFEDQHAISTGEVSVPEGVITMSTNSGNHTVRMVTVDAAEAMARMQEGTVEVDISQLTGDALQQMAGGQSNIGHIQHIIQADGTVHQGDSVAMLASMASGSNDPMSDFQSITLSQPELHGAQLVALQSSDGSQPQLVAVQTPGGSEHENVQVVGATESSALGNGQVILNTQDNNFQAVTIVPSEAGQGGEVSYYLIVPQTEGDAQSASGDFSTFDFARETGREVVEEIIDENGVTRKIIRLKMPGSPDRNAQLMCHYCNYTSPKRYLLTRHLKTHSQDRPHKCGICSRGFKTLASLQNHVNTHTGTRPHKCRECESCFTTSGELVRHVRYRHTFEKPHKCTECDYASVELSKLKRHMRSHTGERPYRCPTCAYASPDAYKLKRHLRIHTGEKPYECDICNARFTQSNSLKAHRLIHSGNKPVFQCELCPTTCGRKTDLKIHMQKLHTAEEPLMCKKCMHTFPDRYRFKVHMRTHDGEKCFKCEECDYAALSQRHLDSHKLTHSGEKPYKCESCGQAFRQKQLLRRHKNLYHTPDFEFASQEGEEQEDEKVLYCSECDQTFVSHVNLMKHMAAHKDSPSKVSQSSGTILHRNIRTEIQEGRLTNPAGKAPHVVIVHLDGTVEEVRPDSSDTVDVATVTSSDVEKHSYKATEELVNKALEKLQSGITEAVASATSKDIDQAAEMSIDGTVKVICVGGELGEDNTETTLQVPAVMIKARLEHATQEEETGNLHVEKTNELQSLVPEQFDIDEDEEEHQDAGTQVEFESESEDEEEVSIPGVSKLPPDSETPENNSSMETFSEQNSVLYLAQAAESMAESADFVHESVSDAHQSVDDTTESVNDASESVKDASESVNGAHESESQDGSTTEVTVDVTTNKTDFSTGAGAEMTSPLESNDTIFVNYEVMNQIAQSINETITVKDVQNDVQANSQKSVKISPTKSTDETGEGEFIGTCSSPGETITAPSSSGEPELTLETRAEKTVDGNIPDNELAGEESPLQRKRGRPPGKRTPKVSQQPKSKSVTPPSVPQRTSPTPPLTPTQKSPGRRMTTRSSPQVNQSVTTTPSKQSQQEDKALRLSGRKRKPDVQVEVPSPVKRSRRLELASKQTGASKK